MLELLEAATIERAMASWKILALANIGLASSSGIFVLCGFPSERAERKGDLIRGSRIIAFTERIPEPPENAEEPVHSALDLFFYYDAEAIHITGATISVPSLKGCSGAAIWEYRESPAMSVWTPEQCLKAVGIQCSFRRDQYFRAKNWVAVLEMLRKYDGQLAALVNDYKSGLARSTYSTL